MRGAFNASVRHGGMTPSPIPVSANHKKAQLAATLARIHPGAVAPGWSFVRGSSDRDQADASSFSQASMIRATSGWRTTSAELK